MAVQGVAAFLGGYACRAQCANLPCRARLSPAGKNFKLSILVHSASLNEVMPGLVQNQRPFIDITVGDKNKQTELGDWAKDRGHWCFREIITLEVNMNDECMINCTASTRYNLYVASVSVNNTNIGELCFPVTSVLPRLRAEDRDTEGLIYATPVMGYDITQDGKVTGRIYLSFETKTPPPSKKGKDPDRCCAFTSDDEGIYRGEESTTASDVGSETARWDGPRFSSNESVDSDAYSGRNIWRPH